MKKLFAIPPRSGHFFKIGEIFHYLLDVAMSSDVDGHVMVMIVGKGKTIFRRMRSRSLDIPLSAFPYPPRYSAEGEFFLLSGECRARNMLYASLEIVPLYAIRRR